MQGRGTTSAQVVIWMGQMRCTDRTCGTFNQSTQLTLYSEYAILKRFLIPLFVAVSTGSQAQSVTA